MAAPRRERRLLPALGIATVLLAGLLVLVHAQAPRGQPQPQTVLSDESALPLDRLGAAAKDKPLRVAIVGGGAGGSSAAFFVSHLASAAGDKEVTIRIFERRDYLGGRSTIIYPFDEPLKGDGGYEPVEAGASIFVGANRNLVKAAKEFNLTTTPYKDSTGDGGRFGVWDGEKMVWEQSPSSQGGRWDQARMLWCVTPSQAPSRSDHAAGGTGCRSGTSTASSSPWSTRT